MKNNLFLIIVLCSLVFASHHYVSNVGTASWANSTNIATPCSTSVAFANAVAGDTVYFRGGTYRTPKRNTSDSYHGYYNVANSGNLSNPIVFMAYPSELPLYTGLAGGSGDATSGSTDIYATEFASNNQSYLVFDGFSFQSDTGKKMARMMIGLDHSDQVGAANGNITIKNCQFYGGSTSATTNTSTDNNEGLRIEGMKNITVSNCFFTQYKMTTDWHNTSAIKTYWDTTVTFTNCEFDTCSVGIYIKEADQKVTVNNCFFKVNYDAFLTSAEIANRSESDTMNFYNNIIANSIHINFIWEGDGADPGLHGNDYNIYNNTFYNSTENVQLGYNLINHGLTFYNNIVWKSSSTYNLVTQDGNATYINHIKQMDHNQWGTPYQSIQIGQYDRDLTYSTLASWQASNQLDAAYDAGCGSSVHPGCGDLASSPLFTNASGHLVNVADFTIPSNSPCYTGGRSGGLIGANAAIVGYNATIPNDTLYLIAGAGGTVLPSSPQVVSAGSIVAVSATPNSNYTFKNWTRKNSTGIFGDSTLASTNFTVNGNDTVTANFIVSGPLVTSIIPDSTSVLGNKKIAINGTNFIGTPVKIGSTGYSNATPQTMTSVSSTVDTITTTAFSRGLYKIYVTNGGGTDSSKTIYFYKASLIYTPSSRIETQNVPSPGGYVATDSAAGDPWDSVGYKTVLPTGLSLNHSTGYISGTPTVAQGATAYVFYAWKYGYKNDSATVTITVVTTTVFYDSSITWQLSTNNFATTVLNVTTTDTNYVVSTPLAYNTTYQFRVRNNNVDTNSVWSDTTTFKTLSMPVPDSVISVYPSVARIDALSTKAQRTIVVKEHGPNKCTVNTVIWLGTVPLGFNMSYTDSTVTDTLFKYPTMPVGTFRAFLTDPSWSPTVSDTLLSAIRLLNPSIIVTKP